MILLLKLPNQNKSIIGYKVQVKILAIKVFLVINKMLLSKRLKPSLFKRKVVGMFLFVHNVVRKVTYSLRTPTNKSILMLLKIHILFIKEHMLDILRLSKELGRLTWLIPSMTTNLTSGLAERFRMLFFRYLANGFLIVKV